MILGIAVLVTLACIPLVCDMYRQGKINISKPEEREFIFEDENGERYNPFDSLDKDEDKEWEYPEDYFK